MSHGAEIDTLGNLQNVYPPVPIEKEQANATAGAAWSVYADAKYGTGVLTVYNATTIGWKYRHSKDMSVADEFYITKDAYTAQK